MRRTRFMSLVLLALSAALLGLQDFRWALETPGWERRYLDWNNAFLATLYTKGAPEPAPLALLPPEKMQLLAQQAEQGDAAAAAFLALHLPPDQREARVRWAEAAVQRDPSLFWVLTCLPAGEIDAGRQAQWLARVEQADPDNAVPHLLRAQFLRRQARDWPRKVSADDPASQEYLLKQKEWMAAMDRGFRAPRYHAYEMDQFLLERRVLTERGWATPWWVLATSTLAVPDLLPVREYANLQALYLGAKEEKAGQWESALRRDAVVANFGERVQQSGNTLLEELMGQALVRIAGKPLAADLDKLGRHEEAAGVRLRMEASAAVRTRDPLLQTTNRFWATLLVHFFFSGVVVFGTLALVALLYLSAKLVVRPGRQGRLYHFMSVLESYSAVLLLVCCFSLYLVFLPYGHNFRSYMSASQGLHTLTYLRQNSIPIEDDAIVGLIGGEGAAFPSPLKEYVFWAVLALLLATGLAALDARRGDSPPPRAPALRHGPGKKSF